jgi:hypothetical protein
VSFVAAASLRDVCRFEGLVKRLRGSSTALVVRGEFDAGDEDQLAVIAEGDIIP